MKYLKYVALALAMVLAVSCSPKLPQKDVDAANAALADAQNAKADVYAPAEFQAVNDSKAALDAEIAAQESKTSGKSYKQTTELAKALSDAAKKAKDAAAANMETAKNDVATMLTDSQALLAKVKAEAELAANDTKKAVKAKLNVKTIAEQVASYETALTDAQAANDAQDYAGAKDKLTALIDQMGATQASLEAAGFTAAN